MNVLDIVLIFFLLAAGFRGYQRGLIISVISILALVLALFLGFALMHQGMAFIGRYIDGFSGLLPLLSFFMIFIAVIVLVSFFGRTIKRVVDFTPLGSLDNLAGAVIGILKGAFGLSVIIWLITKSEFDLFNDSISQSKIYGYIEPIAPFVFDTVSAYLPFLKSIFSSMVEMIKP